jgi:cytoskeletal protein CcmA (bactofilin family)
VLHKTARVDGNIETPSITIEEGALVNGQIKMQTADKSTPALKAVPSPDAKPKS